MNPNLKDMAVSKADERKVLEDACVPLKTPLKGSRGAPG